MKESIGDANPLFLFKTKKLNDGKPSLTKITKRYEKRFLTQETASSLFFYLILSNNNSANNLIFNLIILYLIISTKSSKVFTLINFNFPAFTSPGGIMAVVNPKRSASLKRCANLKTGRTSAPKPTSPNTKV